MQPYSRGLALAYPHTAISRRAVAISNPRGQPPDGRQLYLQARLAWKSREYIPCSRDKRANCIPCFKTGMFKNRTLSSGTSQVRCWWTVHERSCIYSWTFMNFCSWTSIKVHQGVRERPMNNKWDILSSWTVHEQNHHKLFMNVYDGWWTIGSWKFLKVHEHAKKFSRQNELFMNVHEPRVHNSSSKFMNMLTWDCQVSLLAAKLLAILENPNIQVVEYFR